MKNTNAIVVNTRPTLFVLCAVRSGRVLISSISGDDDAGGLFDLAAGCVLIVSISIGIDVASGAFELAAADCASTAEDLSGLAVILSMGGCEGI